MSKKHFKPTKESLSLAKSIADELGIPFDENLTHHQGIWLLDIYFKEICTVLPEETKYIQFENLASRDFAAFIEPTTSKPRVYMDQQLQFFLLSAFFINAIWACRVLDNETKNDLKRLFSETIYTLHNPYHHESLREKELLYIQQFIEELKLANALTICALAFIMCHEIAHKNLDHLNQPASHYQEFEADKLAFSYLGEVAKHFETLPNLKIAPNKTGAPILAFEYLAIAESTSTDDLASHTHPLSLSRGRNLHNIFMDIADKETKYLYDGFKKSILELSSSQTTQLN